MKKIRTFIHSRIKMAIPFLAKMAGVQLLNKKQTLAILANYRVFYEKAETAVIPIAGLSDDNAPDDYKQQQSFETSSIGVYHIKAHENKIKIYSYGGVNLNGKVLDMDFGSALFIDTFKRKDKRPVVKSDTCIVLWAHQWGNGYYDYLFFIYSKLLRIKQIMGEVEFNKAKIAYPFFNTAFEKELLTSAGVKFEQVINIRETNVQSLNYYLADNNSWYFHNKKSVDLLRCKWVEIAGSKAEVKLNNRIYISRRGRRKLTNEAEIIEVLKKLDFTVIEDIPRSVAEQALIYKNASVIVGPHGASFSNIVACDPGVVLVELFPANYYPTYFRYLAAVLKLKYFAVFEAGVQGTHYRNLDEDLYIDPEKLVQLLHEIL